MTDKSKKVFLKTREQLMDKYNSLLDKYFQRNNCKV